MADEAQIIYEYSVGADVSFKTNDLIISYHREGLSVSKRPDGNIYVDDPGIEHRKFSFSAIISGADMNELNTVQMAAITYDATYPRIKKIYFAGAVTITNIEVVCTSFSGTDLGNGFWNVQMVLEEYTTA
jgi:hypothetical protein